jgi:hypothetical protein
MVSIQIALALKKLSTLSVLRNTQLMVLYFMNYEFAFYESQYMYRSYSSREPPDYLLK